MKYRLEKLLLITTLVSSLFLSCVAEASSAEAKKKLGHARQLLTGKNKQLDKARHELLELIKQHEQSLDAYDLCISYVYLGYIDDLQGNRMTAVRWFTKGTQVQGNISGIRSVAAKGISEPITWLRHLDAEKTQVSSQRRQTPAEPERAGRPPAKKTVRAIGLQEAKELLTGPDKDLAGAGDGLFQLVRRNGKELSPVALCTAYVYLGYIEDLQGNRKKAMRWFKLGAGVRGDQVEGIRSIAELGLKKPVTWIKHLDAGSMPAARKAPKENVILQQIGQGAVYRDQPAKKTLQMNLTGAEMEENFEILIQAIDRQYSFFIHKELDWERICQAYRTTLKTVTSSEQFYEMIYDFVCELKDAHSWLINYQPKSRMGKYGPAVTLRRIEGKAVVVDIEAGSKAYEEGVRPGWILTAVDRKPVDAYLEGLGERISMSSSERHYREKATRMLLRGEKNSPVLADFLSLTQTPINTIALERDQWCPEYVPELTFPTVRLGKIMYGRHGSGYGYIRILTFSGRMEIADEFDTALEKLRNTQGLIIDIRENPGGFGTCQKRIIGRFLSEKAAGTISYRRNGSEHGDFSKRAEMIDPCGRWQYDKPVGLLMNAITGSASDLFAARFISTERVKSMGQTTHGNVTGVGVYAELPCHLQVRISNGYIADASGRIIEGNGNEPEIKIEPTIDEARRKIDGVLERAFVALANESDKKTTVTHNEDELR